MLSERWTEVDELHSAVYAGDDVRVAWLLRAQSALAAESLACAPLEGSSPLHVAARAGATELVDILLSFGAEAAARDGRGATPAVLASAGGHHSLACSLERAAAAHSVASASRRRRSHVWCFWRLFRRDWGAALAPWVWVCNAGFAGYVYCTRMASTEVHVAAHMSLQGLYMMCWGLWAVCVLARPAPVDVAARAAYTAAVAALAGGCAEPQLDGWLSHAHRAALRPRQARDPASGLLVQRYDHRCFFVANSVGLHNQRAFLGFVCVLTVACAQFTYIALRQRRLSSGAAADGLVEAALLDMGLGTLAVGQLALWQARLAARNATAHELRCLGRGGWDQGPHYHMLKGQRYHNPFDRGWRANWAEFWARAQPTLPALAQRSAGSACTTMTAAGMHAAMEAQAQGGDESLEPCTGEGGVLRWARRTLHSAMSGCLGPQRRSGHGPRCLKLMAL